MDTSQEARVQRHIEILKPELKRTTDHAYWIGFTLGVLLGLALGVAIGYDLGSDTVLIVPLEPEVEA